MKRLLLISIISLLLVSGWSHVLAAALCPRMQARASCHMLLEHHTSSAHEAMKMTGEMGEMQMSETTLYEGEVDALGLPSGSCPHCFYRSENPTSTVVAVKGVERSRRDQGVILQQAIKAFAPLATSFTPPISKRQHAPPGATTTTTTTARHVLISIFLI